MTRENRKLTVTRLYRERMGLVPQLRINGRWLEKAGFEIGRGVSIKIEEGRLIIERGLAYESY
jgi:hypothetical protein